MEYFEAGDLSKCRESIQGEKDIRAISYQIALGLQRMHALNIIHRDLKPQVGNIIQLAAETCPLILIMSERFHRCPKTSMEGQNW